LRELRLRVIKVSHYHQLRPHKQWVGVDFSQAQVTTVGNSVGPQRHVFFERAQRFEMKIGHQRLQSYQAIDGSVRAVRFHDEPMQVFEQRKSLGQFKNVLFQVFETVAHRAHNDDFAVQ
jgi:hypothetical protein